MPSRRTVLATVGSLVGSGCLGPAGGPGPTDAPARNARDGSPTDDEHTGGPRSADGCTAGYHVTAEPFDPARDLTVRLDDPERALVGDAVEEGPVAVDLYAGSPPLDDDAYVEYDGTYYETATSQVDTTEIPAVVTNVEWEKGQEAPDGSDVVAFDDLPESDREALRFAVYGGRFDRERHGHPREGLSVREAPIPYPSGTGDSVLVGDGERWVRWNDRTYRVWTAGETTTTRNRFHVEVTAVAGDADAFREHVAEHHLLELADLSSAGREVLREATEGTYEECEPASEGLAALQSRLPEDDRLPPPRNDAWYVAFEGERHELHVHQWVH